MYMVRVRFLSGFVSATILWAGLFFSYLHGGLDFLLPAEEPTEAIATAVSTDGAAGPPSKGKRRGLKRPRLNRRAGGGSSGPAANNGTSAAGSGGNSTVGDDLGWDKERNVDMNGGEGQLSGGQIDAGFDSMMGRIRRCLILVPSDGEVTGKLVFGMRVGSDGKARAVNLSGPSIVTGGDSGSCLRSAAQGIQFASFNGPDMLFKYPITLQ